MFGPNPNSSGHGNTVLVGGRDFYPTPFVWPYGGRHVYLTGSFTGWSEHILMSPTEGCPTVFQALCNLPAGFHQYKFNVDGEWRHDELQPSVSGNYGVVNTVIVPREHDPRMRMYAPDNRVNMEVDDAANRCTMMSPDGVLQEQISQDDVQVSRHRIGLFLSQHTAYELLPESGKVVALDVTLPVKQAFHILYEQGVPVAPLWDCTRGHFVGVLSAIDFILILRELGNNGSNLTEEELETHTILAWKDGKTYNRQIDGSGRPCSTALISAGPYDSLKDVALKILANDVSTVPIIHSSSPDGSFPQLLHLASLSGVLKCVCRHFKNSSSSLPILQKPICSLPLGTWVPPITNPCVRKFTMLKSNASLGTVLQYLVEDKVSAVPLVDENDSLVDVYSRSDITSLAKDRAYAQIRLDEVSILQALQLGQDANSPYGVFNGQRCQMCLRSDPLHKVMDRLSNPGVRRLVIVEAGSKRVEGIITVRDVLKFLLS